MNAEKIPTPKIFIILFAVALLLMFSVVLSSASQHDPDSRSNLRLSIESLSRKLSKISPDSSGIKLVIETSNGLTKVVSLNDWPSYASLPALLKQMFREDLPLFFLLWFNDEEGFFLIDDDLSLGRAISSSSSRLHLLLSIGRSPAFNCPLAIKGLLPSNWRDHHNALVDFITAFQSDSYRHADIQRKPNLLFGQV